MSSYSNSHGVSSFSSTHTPFLPSKLREHHSGSAFVPQDDDPIGDCIAALRQAWQAVLRLWNTRAKRATMAVLVQLGYQLRRNLAMRRLLSVPHVLVLIWMLVLLWGERWIFHTKVESCRWDNWETWPSEATPHHLIFVADPQITDPHSYPGRPWPLSSLTVLITDNYMRRSYNQLQAQLHPDTLFFLGDLFDGGREWKTHHGNFEDPSWNHRPKGEVGYAKKWKKKYGQKFWAKEYLRFHDMFFKPWNLAGPEAGPGQSGRKLIASLPGNHDFGFGSEVKIPARDRFEAYFGDVNRVDVIANHTFVSVDTLSLSARTSREQLTADLSGIYKPAEEFLSKVQSTKRRAVGRELRRMRGEVQEMRQEHIIIDEVGSMYFSNIPTSDPGEGKAELPTILLSHVPLYRPPGTPCGPMREHWPPANPAQAVDHRNAISVSGGYQYQNVLNEADSIDLVNKVGNVVHAFSGDDHDYCELTHADNQANVKEITVKSISMVMGVRTPGFLMVSMYNPIDEEGKPLGDQSHTLQTHLCLLPNQLSTYARYGGLAFVCLVALAIRAFLVPILNMRPFALEPDEPGKRPKSILPVFKPKVENDDSKQSMSGHGVGYSASSYHSSPHRSNTRDRSASFTPGVRANGLAAQGRNASPGRGVRPAGNTRGLGRHSSNREKGRDASRWGWGEGGPKIEIDIGDGDEYYYDAGKSRWRASSSKRVGTGSRGALRTVWTELWTTVWRTLWMVVVFWGWLAYKV